MRNNSIHPFSIPTHARIDVIYGGNQREVVRDSMTLARQSVNVLSKGEHVLILNTIAQRKAIEEVAEAISERHAAKIVTYSESGAELIQHLAMLAKMVEEKQVRVIVLNSLEWATQTPRQRRQLVHWLRKMRDDFGARAIIYTMNEPQKLGATGQLAWIADTITETAAWRHAAPIQAIEAETPPNNANLELRTMLQEVRAQRLEHIHSIQKNVKPSLINNDLALVGSTHGGVLQLGGKATERELEFA